MKTFTLSLIFMLFASGMGIFSGRGTGELIDPNDPIGTPVPLEAPAAPQSPEYTGCGGVTAPMVNDDYEQQVVELVNAARLSNGNLPPLKRVDGLGAAARYHAADLGQDNYFSHDSYDRSGGNLVFVCDTWTRIAKYTPGANGENIAGGYSTPQSVMDAWMGSQGHHDNILNSYSWELGVGYYQGSGTYYVYWVQDFGRRSGVYPLVINREAAYTDTRHVTLYIYGSWSEMRLRNDSGAWTDWQPFQTQSSWTLGGGVGLHSVTAELRKSGSSATSSDTINLTTDDGTPALGGLPDEVHFMYSLADQRLSPPSFHVTPLNTGGPDSLSWTTEVSGTWFTVTPGQGTTPDGFDITPLPVQGGPPTTYTGVITVTATSPGGATVQGSPTTITVTMEVVDGSMVLVYLPEVRR
jgi:uncharacterized protein YkwD